MTREITRTEAQVSAAGQTRHWLRSLALYAGLVGVPSLGVAGIIRVGERITPPMAVGGRWDVTFAADAAVAPGCFAVDSAAQPIPLTIVQSGTHVTVTIGDPVSAAGDGRLDGERVEVTLPAPREPDRCESSVPTTLAASIARDDARRTLTGELARPGCASCAPLAFRAEHSTEPKG